jgi:hypothetical protein
MLLGPRADRTVQRTRQQVVHLLAVQRADRQPGDHLVVPQIGRRTGSRGEQHLGAVVPDDLLQQPDGRVVEQVVDGVAQWVARVQLRGQQRRQRAERDVRRRSAAPRRSGVVNARTAAGSSAVRPTKGHFMITNGKVARAVLQIPAPVGPPGEK